MANRPIESTKPDPRDIAQVVDLISASVEQADKARSHIINVVGVYLNAIRLLSAWEDPVPGAGDWKAAAERTLEIAKKVRWTPPPSGSRAGPEDVQALQTFLEAIPTLMSAVEELGAAQAPLDVRIAARGICATLDCESQEADVLEQVHRATGIPKDNLAERRENWLAAAWEAIGSPAWTVAENLKVYLRGAIGKNKQHLDVEYGKPGELGYKDRNDLDVDKRAAERLESGKSWERRDRVEHPELTPGIEVKKAPRLVMESDTACLYSQWDQTRLAGADLLIAIEETCQRMEVVEKFQKDEASQLELEFLAAIVNGAETPKEVLAATGGEANRSKYQDFRRKMARRLKID